MVRGRTTGSKNIKYYKYALMINGGWEFYTSQNAVLEKVDINRTKLNRIINHPEIVQNCQIVCKKLDNPLPVFKQEKINGRLKYSRIIYDSKGNDVETPISSDEE